MNAAHIHLMINHAPVMGALGALALLFWALFRRSLELQRTALLAWVVVALATIPAYVSGGYAEDIVQDMPGVSLGRISSHDDAAGWALAMIALTGAWALFGLWRFRRSVSLPRWFVAVLVLLGVLSVLTVARTANLGGQIRHEEARPGWTPPAPSSPEKPGT